MATLAQSRLAQFADWLDRSSEDTRSPCGDRVLVGRYAEILPWDFDEPPTQGFDEHALPLFVAHSQAVGLKLPPQADLSEPSSQQRTFFRLSHIIAKVQDTGVAHMTPWRGVDGNGMPLLALFGLTDPLEPIGEAVSRQGGDAVDLEAVPVLAVPLWALSSKERAEIEASLPFLP